MILASSGPPGRRLRGVLRASWAVLGNLGGFLGGLGVILGRLDGVFGGLGGNLDHLGPSWRPSWTNVTILEAILSRLGGFFADVEVDCAAFRVAGGLGLGPRRSSFGKRTKNKL